MPDTIFITGSGGFVGRALGRLPGAGPTIIALGRHQVSPAVPLPSREGASLVHLAWPDLRASAAAGGPRGADEDTWRRFVDDSIALRRACDAQDVAFVGVGSGIETCTGADLREPYLTYARRKAELRRALATTAAAPFSWVRLHFLFGPGEHPDRVVPAAIRAARSGTALACGARDRRRHWLAVDDLAAALRDFAARPVPGVWDIAGRQATSFEALFGLIGQAVGKPVTLIEPAAPVADGQIKLIAPTNLVSTLPPTFGLPANLLARLTEYAVSIDARGD